MKGRQMCHPKKELRIAWLNKNLRQSADLLPALQFTMMMAHIGHRKRRSSGVCALKHFSNACQVWYPLEYIANEQCRQPDKANVLRDVGTAKDTLELKEERDKSNRDSKDKNRDKDRGKGRHREAERQRERDPDKDRKMRRRSSRSRSRERLKRERSRYFFL